MRLCNKLSSWRNHQSDLITDLAIPAGGIQLPLEIIPSKQHKNASDSILMMKQHVS